jgi:hypothetical protein
LKDIVSIARPRVSPSREFTIHARFSLKTRDLIEIEQFLSLVSYFISQNKVTRDSITAELIATMAFRQYFISWTEQIKWNTTAA